MGLIAEEEPAIAYLLDASSRTHSKNMQSYLTMMAVRLLEMRRILKRTGSIYLHCDSVASHYLKALLDAIFGRNNFRNEIIWSYKKTSNSNAKKFLRAHDTILFYSRSNRRIWNTQYKSQISERKKELIEAGYNTKNMDGKKYLYIYDEENFSEKERRGGVNRKDFDVIRYIDPTKGKRISDVFEIPHLNSQSKEKLGYPTQKPLALVERIIKASSNKGDLVLDPFCGCATACVAAEKLERSWIGIDISSKAAELVNLRLQAEMGSLFHKEFVTTRTDIPQRTDLAGSAPKNYRQNKHVLYGEQEGYCGGCRSHFEFRNLEVDHIVPRARGGTNHLKNLQLLCGHCNRVKGDRPQEYLLAQLARA